MRPVFWVAIFTAAVVSVLLVAQNSTANTVLALSVPVILLCFAGYLLSYPCSCLRIRSLPPVYADASAAAANRQGGGARSSYLDVIKVFLTCCVVLHHAVGAFNGSGLGLSVGVYRSTFQAFAVPFLSLQQSYFMCLFFFISALFVPTSLARKGTRAFLADKAKRLVLPFALFFFVLFPLLIGGLGAGVISKQVNSISALLLRVTQIS
jgi:hypothetical protein